MIPKIIHNIWYQGKNNIPPTYPNYTNTWKQKHPHFKYIFWDEDKITKLIINHYPHLYHKFSLYPRMIQRIDMAKYIIIYHCGGVYVDVDSECLKPIDKLLDNNKVILAEASVNILEKYISHGRIFKKVLQNGFFGGIKGHKFFKHCINVLLNENIKKKKLEGDLKYIFRTTGPGLLTKAYYTYPNRKKEITLISHNLIDPISWCNYEANKCNIENCSKNTPNAYSIHHYGSRHSTYNWTSNLEKKIGLLYCKHKKYVIPIAIIIILIIIYYIYKYKIKNKK
uniref:Glycosyltransferase n=1 Tax=Mimivirus LCMiAC02 TaxID=2506609 RepID=A0A481Z0W1_9VIRU|nr:MAG: glycosyltransferase [Mimivirus LCMiAC02]